MPRIVKIITSDSGEKYKKPKWHLIEVIAGGNATFCGGEFFGYGESGCEYKTKVTERGGITCEECLEKIRRIKAVKL